ncbi:universal stress protein UspA [Mycolicibacterium acapulense]|uniref:Universal stress protein UspA n=1 Tax=Mycobacterium lehmannii TaxID=2048550 RepID=A0A101ACY1_9MYCO|nr:universal stress protein [Mycobacterium lehmannii]KUI02930.1 universal stress protein UspA [Mycolicibacterium acapulense]KUI09068.1 universal stress protein UspA [Mycolicibacterium acapulense]KUI09385.1 universal stress protein UspA [Mycolicibacterium acapulense]KUI20681.1 universal stress protein UspA [Mycobacterium lehmannii]
MRLVVGYLATPGGADALALGVRFARTLGADLDLCMVLPPDRVTPSIKPVGDFEKHLVAQAEQWLEEARAAVPDDIVVRSHVRVDDSPADALIQEAARVEADMIVAGGSGGLVASYSLGSTVNALLHSAPLPVAVAPRGTRHSPVDRTREVTCAIGEREGADVLLDIAVQYSRVAGAPLRLVSLVALDPTFGTLRGDGDAVREHALAHARHVLELAKSELPQDFPVTSMIVEGRTIEEAVGKLDWQDGDLIMVGSSRLSAPRRLFLGSKAAKMLRVLDVPMVVVPREQLGPDDLP